MHGVRLDHTTIDTADLAATLAFFGEFLALRPGWRPDFGFPGAWLYPSDSDYAIVHLIEKDAPNVRNAFNHIAFRGVGLHAYIAKLKRRGAWFEAASVPGTSYTQVHHHDPNGLKIEVIFQEPLGTDVVRPEPTMPAET